ncbi:MAG: hypothetical protein AAGA70_08215 [Pseudomonadota bacterium]
MNPFLAYAPKIEFPLSGDVTQDILPGWFSQMKGLPEIEREIVTSVWGYGSQLGTLTDALLEVVDELNLTDSVSVAKLRQKQAETEAAKHRAMRQIRDRIGELQARLDTLEAAEKD